MLKIQLYKFNQKDESDYLYLINNKNAILKYENNRMYVKRGNLFQEFQFSFEEYTDMELLPELIVKVIISSHNQVKNWKMSEGATEEGFGFVGNYSEETVLKDVQNWLYWLDQNNKLNVLDICCWVSFKILSKHYWENGNKRTSVLTLMNLLETFNLFLSCRNLGDDDIEDRWYDTFVDYLTRSERKLDGTKENIETVYKDFYNEIKRATFINAKYIV